MKLYERPRIDKTHDQLPEMPPGVEVPDDISGLRPPTTAKPTTGGVRWMRWLAAIVVLVAVGVMAAVLISGGTTEIDQADVYGSDRHLASLQDLAANRNIDYMATYGTDNPVIVGAPVEVSTIQLEAYGSDRHLATWQDLATNRAIDYMDVYGTDNPVFVQAEAKDTGEYMATYGTDNPAFVQVPKDTGEYMATYGTDNPVFVETVTEVATPMFGPNEGPGSNSLAPTSPEAAPMFGPNEGPGSNSLAP